MSFDPVPSKKAHLEIIKLIALKKLLKMFLFHLKSIFCYEDIKVFVFPFSRLSTPVSHCSRK